MLKRLVLTLAALAFSAGVHAQQFTAGIDYTVLTTAQPTDAKGKVEVVEFFWYGCPHCYTLEPKLEAWIKKLPADVEFKRVPATFNEQWRIAGRVFYTLEAMGEVDRLHGPLFDAVHRDGLKITNERDLTAWLAKNKVDVEKYKATYKSFAVDGKVRRSDQMIKAYQLDGVPALAVQGKYVVLAGQAGTHQRMLDITDHLIGVARKELGKK